jgi:methionine-R-sulfoxide reductase
MKNKVNNFIVLFCIMLSASCQNNSTTKTTTAKDSATATVQKTKNPFIMDTTKWNKTEEEWKKILTPEQYAILREKGTERPGTGKYNLHFEKGKYVCSACGFELFTSGSKFESHCGWPSFDEEIAAGRIKTKVDNTFGMKRTEIMCAQCGGHLGHVFDDGPTKTGLRYCVNSVSIEFKEDKKEEKK